MKRLVLSRNMAHNGREGEVDTALMGGGAGVLGYVQVRAMGANGDRSNAGGQNTEAGGRVDRLGDKELMGTVWLVKRQKWGLAANCTE